MVKINRRKLITGLISFVAAPAIVRASSLMQVKVMDSFDPVMTLDEYARKVLEPMFNHRYEVMMLRCKQEMLEITGITDKEFYL